mmetsp:Transcript_40845/g.68282  ORF Transcript_40845/g.68282 Transcript_40845/m.68282 type:complete len:86 (+) Transcript_40845:77-334(+)
MRYRKVGLVLGTTTNDSRQNSLPGNIGGEGGGGFFLLQLLEKVGEGGGRLWKFTIDNHIYYETSSSSLYSWYDIRAQLIVLRVLS